jgi:CheY-like chemotaxis protein
MAAPILLVADDLSLIAAVKRVLAREGYECVLATSAADAIIAFGHALPGLLLLQPSVESRRGGVVLEELKTHPDAQLLRVLLLGETIAGFASAVEPLPIDPAHFAQAIDENFRAAQSGAGWQVRESGTDQTSSTPPPPPASPRELEPWRATRLDASQMPNTEPPPEPAMDPPSAAPWASGPSAATLERRLFGDLPSLEDELHRDVEAHALASVESSLAQQDDELRKLEDEVRAEAARRRESPQSGDAASVLSIDPVAPMGEAGEHSFADLGTVQPQAPAAPESRAAATLARAEQMLLECRAVADAHRRADDADARRALAELEAASRRSEHAESLVRHERELRAQVESALEAAQAEAAALQQERAQLLEQFASGQQGFEALQQQLAAAEGEVQEREQQLAELARRRDERIAELTRTREERLAELNRQQGEAISALTRRHDEQLALVRGELAEALAATALASVQAQAGRDTQALFEHERAQHEVTRQALVAAQHAAEQATASAADVAAQTAQLDAERVAHDATRGALAEAEARLLTLGSDNTLAQHSRAEAQRASEAAQEAQARVEVDAAMLREQLVALQHQLTERTELLEAATLQRKQFEQQQREAASSLGQARAASAQQDAQLATLRDELERTQARQAAAVRELAQLKDSLETTRSRAEQAEASATFATEKVRDLEARDTMPLSLPGRQALGVARHGTVDLDGLARLFCSLVLAGADVRVELGVVGGARTLWLKKGHIIAAESAFDAEGLVDRARRDGLIDARQEAELRMLRTATLREQLEALKTRGFIRDAEAVPLVQRCAEQIALEAMAEPVTQYRLADEAPGPEVTLVTMPRATLPLLAEALRRAVPADALLEKLGGGEAVPVPTDAEWDLRSLGFSDRERKMLTWADGEATVEDVCLASGLKPDVAFRALLVAKLLGVVELKAPAARAPVVDADLEVRRLDAKYDEVQDADYFTVLGLTRTAGADDVQRAWQRLSSEFHPLRFSGHPDAGLQQRAQVVFGLLEEAARALEDDHRRQAYAAHLFD